MPKVTVKATVDFFDGVHQTERKKDDVFSIRVGYAQALGKKVEVVKEKRELSSLTAAPKKTAKKAAPKKVS